MDDAQIARLEARIAELEARAREAQAEHQRVVAALALSEERFSKAFLASPDSVNLNRLSDGLYVAINPGFTALTGYTEADVSGRTSLELDLWADPANRQRLVQELRTRGQVDNLEADFRMKDGSVKPALMSARILEVGGERCILSITRDISAQRRAAEDLRRSEERLRELIELAVDAIVLGDPKGVITWVNRRGCELLGRPREEVVGLSISQIFAPGSLQATPLRFDLLAQGLTVVSERYVAQPNGTLIPVEMSSRRMPDGTYHSFIRDLTERRRAEEERTRFEARLQTAERTEAIGRLAGGIAHDFNNLLTPILGSASLLLDEPGLSETVRIEAQGILEAAERAAELTRQILAFSRKQVLQLQTLDLNAEIARTERMLRRVIGEDVHVELALQPEPLYARVDASQLQQVLLNLAVNARDAMPDGGRLRISSSACAVDAQAASQHPGIQPGRCIRLEVSDTGVGMDAETARHAFDPFFTTKTGTTHGTKGTGLGLATVRGIVEQHGGVVWIDSRPGAGATFSLLLPRAEAPNGSRASPTPAARTRGSEVVLLVEDDERVRGTACRILEHDGYRVLAAAGGQEALRIARALDQPPDLLVTDVIMPGMNGRQLRDELCRHFPHLKVLYVSGYPDNVLAPHGVLESQTRLLGKPFTAPTLSAAVRAALDEEP